MNRAWHKIFTLHSIKSEFIQAFDIFHIKSTPKNFKHVSLLNERYWSWKVWNTLFDLNVKLLIQQLKMACKSGSHFRQSCTINWELFFGWGVRKVWIVADVLFTEISALSSFACPASYYCISHQRKASLALNHWRVFLGVLKWCEKTTGYAKYFNQEIFIDVQGDDEALAKFY